MNFFQAMLGTTLTFLIVDAIWIALFVKSFYDREVGHLMSDSPNFAAAAIFYLLYAAGIVYLAVMPALQTGQFSTAVLHGAALGALAYGTFTITNYAVLKGWPVSIVVTDIAWGIFLTALSAAAGYVTARIFS